MEKKIVDWVKCNWAVCRGWAIVFVLKTVVVLLITKSLYATVLLETLFVIAIVIYVKIRENFSEVTYNRRFIISLVMLSTILSFGLTSVKVHFAVKTAKIEIAKALELSYNALTINKDMDVHYFEGDYFHYEGGNTVVWVDFHGERVYTYDAHRYSDSYNREVDNAAERIVFDMHCH